MKPSLVVLAAGIGSRYGGIKQLDGFGPNGEKIIDYTVYDALKVGFGKIIFVIREDIQKDFEHSILAKWKDKGEFYTAFQELDRLPDGYQVPEGRIKPWGTAHATWMAEDLVKEPFAIVNADDFYGYGSLKAAHDHLIQMDTENHGACLVGYEIGNTLTDSGSVSRGLCESDNEGFLTEIIERTKISRNGEGNIYFEEDGTRTYIQSDTLVSMNLMGFSPKVFEEIALGFKEIYKLAATNPKVEYYIPTVLNSLIQKGIKAPVIPTRDQWFGVTYLEDKDWVMEQFRTLHANKVYPSNLFE